MPTATPDIYPPSLHDALPIYAHPERGGRHHHVHLVGGELLVHPGAVGRAQPRVEGGRGHAALDELDRKSTRLNSSHVASSYAVFCLKKKKQDARDVN